MGKYSW